MLNFKIMLFNLKQGRGNHVLFRIYGLGKVKLKIKWPGMLENTQI
jgi:hypothetical protein